MSSRKKDNKFKVIADVNTVGEDLSITNMEVISKEPKINKFTISYEGETNDIIEKMIGEYNFINKIYMNNKNTIILFINNKWKLIVFHENYSIILNNNNENNKYMDIKDIQKMFTEDEPACYYKDGKKLSTAESETFKTNYSIIFNDFSINNPT